MSSSVEAPHYNEPDANPVGRSVYGDDYTHSSDMKNDAENTTSANSNSGSLIKILIEEYFTLTGESER